MKEVFLKTVVACLAVASLGLGTYVVSSGVSSISTDNIRSVVSAMDAQRSASADDTGAETVLKGLRKFGGILLPK